MRLVIENYSDHFSTEPLYFHACSQKAGIASALWNKSQMNVFDMFDAHKPDVFITHISKISDDVIKYLSRHGSAIDVVVNITGASQGEIDAFAEVLKNNNIKSPFLFNNQILRRTPIIVAPPSVKIESIFYGADMFLVSNTQAPGPTLQAGIIAIGNSFKETLLSRTCEQYETYHKIVVGAEKTKDYDISASVFELVALYKKYDEIILLNQTSAGLCGQIMLDAVIHNGNVDISCNEHLIAGEIDGVLDNVKRKYTCFHSASRLLSKLGLKDQALELSKLAESL